MGEAEKELAGPAGSNPYARLVDEAEGLDKIEDLQNHANEDIYEKVVSIMESFFDVEDGEVENLAPQVLPPHPSSCSFTQLDTQAQPKAC